MKRTFDEAFLDWNEQQMARPDWGTRDPYDELRDAFEAGAAWAGNDAAIIMQRDRFYARLYGPKEVAP